MDAITSMVSIDIGIHSNSIDLYQLAAVQVIEMFYTSRFVATRQRLASLRSVRFVQYLLFLFIMCVSYYCIYL